MYAVAVGEKRARVDDLEDTQTQVSTDTEAVSSIGTRRRATTQRRHIKGL